MNGLVDLQIALNQAPPSHMCVTLLLLPGTV